jgi:hypothetical protein
MYLSTMHRKETGLNTEGEGEVEEDLEEAEVQ